MGEDTLMNPKRDLSRITTQVILTLEIVFHFVDAWDDWVIESQIEAKNVQNNPFGNKDFFFCIFVSLDESKGNMIKQEIPPLTCRIVNHNKLLR